MSEPVTWQYVAGFFDGEGSLSKLGYGNGQRRMVLPAVQIAQKDRTVLDLIDAFFRAQGVRRVHIYFGKNKWGGFHILRVQRPKDVLLLLSRLTPFLIVKRGQAEAAIVTLTGYTQTHRSYG